MTISRLLLVAVCLLLPLTMASQRIQQPLGRGVVAVNHNGNVTVTWRRLAQDPEDATYRVYADGNLLTTTPRTCWKTTSGKIPVGTQVTVSVVTPQGEELAQSVPFEVKNHDMRNIFLDINFEKGGSPLASAQFNTAYVWPIDLDGDGEMDYVVNRKSNSNALDCYVEGYLRNGQHLWTVKLGPNELSCAGQDDMITVADMDCDGKGEVIIQSSDGTQFWDAEQKDFGRFVMGHATGDTDGDGIIDYETQTRRNAPRYISVIDGMTGAEKASIEQSYNQHYNRTNRAELMGDEYNKHVGHMGVCYFDGVHPGVVMEWHIRGTAGDHHYYNIGVAYDFTSGKAGALKELFNRPTGGAAFHQIRVGDVDGDGRDEMIEGGYTMNHDGSTLFNTGIAHGDRFRTSDIDPERPGLETFAIQQNAGDMLGQVLYDARTGEFIKKWYLPSVGDVGRGECMDIDRAHLGWEMWSTMGKVYDAQGNLIEGYDSQYPCEGIWWDNEPDREVVQSSDSHYNVYIQDFFKGREVEFAKISNYRYVTVYAKRAAFWGDIIGDWREELILLHKENGITVGITGVSTDYLSDLDYIYCLQQDPHYRGDCSTKGYYQSPNPGFYLGYDMPRPQLPPCMVTDLVAASDGRFVAYDHATPASYAPGKSVLFDLTFQGERFTLHEAFSPSCIYAMPVRGQRIVLDGEGSVEGELQLWKGQQGRLVVNVPLAHTGGTFISEGVLEVNGRLDGDVELRARGTLAGNAVLAGQLRAEGALNYEGCRLMPGTEENKTGTITLQQGLSLNSRLFVESDICADGTDLVRVEGDLTLGPKAQLVFTIVTEAGKPAPGQYRLMEYTGEFSGDLTQVSLRGLEGISCSIRHEDKALWLVIHEQREMAEGVRWTGAESNVWDYQTANFMLEGKPSEFVAGDGVVIGDDAVTGTILMDQQMPVGGLTFENDTKAITLKGTGGLAGSGDVVVKGKGRVTLDVRQQTYTGRTLLQAGTVSVSELADGGVPSSLGAASAVADYWQMGKATLIVNNTNTATNRPLTLNDTATIQVASGVVALKGLVKGKGRLVKKGAGQLNITYAGQNTWASTELCAGTLAMGAWNTSFGKAGSPLDVTGNATLVVFDNNSSSAVPVLNNAITVSKGKTLTLQGGKRCKVQGSMAGQGTVKVSFPYVRGDFSTSLTDFEGTLNPTSGQFRLTSGMTMQKGTLKLGEGVYAVGVKAQSGTEVSLTHKIGTLSSTAADAQLGTGIWNVGYLGVNSTFAGTIGGGATLQKYGEGTLTLSGTGEGKVVVYEGTIAGTGTVGTLTLKEGAALQVKGRSNGTLDLLKVTGKVSLNNPLFRMERFSGTWKPDVDYELFNGPVTLTGTPSFEPAVPAEGYRWDYSLLASQGILRVVPDETGITGVNELKGQESEWDLSGRKVSSRQKGWHVSKGKKIWKK